MCYNVLGDYMFSNELVVDILKYLDTNIYSKIRIADVSNHFNYNLGTLIVYPINEYQNIKIKKKIIKKSLNSMTIKYKIDNDKKENNKLRLF